MARVSGATKHQPLGCLPTDPPSEVQSASEITLKPPQEGILNTHTHVCSNTNTNQTDTNKITHTQTNKQANKQTKHTTQTQHTNARHTTHNTQHTTRRHTNTQTLIHTDPQTHKNAHTRQKGNRTRDLFAANSLAGARQISP